VCVYVCVVHVSVCVFPERTSYTYTAATAAGATAAADDKRLNSWRNGLVEVFVPYSVGGVTSTLPPLVQ